MKYRIIFSPKSYKDIEKLEKSGDKKSLKKLFTLLEELASHPTYGTGKPEQLKHYKTPTWSRRINDKHRLVYSIEQEVVTVLVLSAWGHYEDK